MKSENGGDLVPALATCFAKRAEEGVKNNTNGFGLHVAGGDRGTESSDPYVKTRKARKGKKSSRSASSETNGQASSSESSREKNKGAKGKEG